MLLPAFLNISNFLLFTLVQRVEPSIGDLHSHLPIDHGSNQLSNTKLHFFVCTDMVPFNKVRSLSSFPIPKKIHLKLINYAALIGTLMMEM